MLDYILNKMVDAVCCVLAMVGRCVFAVFATIVNFAISATVDFFTLSCVQVVLTTIRNFILLAIRNFFAIRCVQDICERILNLLTLIILTVLSFNDQERFRNLLLDRWLFCQRKLNERLADSCVKLSQSDSLRQELVDVSNEFYVSEVIPVRKLFLYAQLLYQATRAALQFLQSYKNCEIAESTFNAVSRLVNREFPEMFE